MAKGKSVKRKMAKKTTRKSKLKGKSVTKKASNVNKRVSKGGKKLKGGKKSASKVKQRPSSSTKKKSVKKRVKKEVKRDKSVTASDTLHSRSKEDLSTTNVKNEPMTSGGKKVKKSMEAVVQATAERVMNESEGTDRLQQSPVIHQHFYQRNESSPISNQQKSDGKMGKFAKKALTAAVVGGLVVGAQYAMHKMQSSEGASEATKQALKEQQQQQQQKSDDVEEQPEDEENEGDENGEEADNEQLESDNDAASSAAADDQQPQQNVDDSNNAVDDPNEKQSPSHENAQQ